MAKIRILITDGLGIEGIDRLRSHPDFELDVRKSVAPDELRKIIGGYQAILTRNPTPLPKDVLTHAQELELIVRAAVGVDNIDLETARKMGIEVRNCATSNSVSAAEHTLGLLLSVMRRIPESNRALREGRWDRTETFQGREIQSKTLGVIGVGNIGKIVSSKAMALGMRVVAFDIKYTSIQQLPEKFRMLEGRFKLLRSMDEVLAAADAVTLHVPKNPENLNLISREKIALMKPGSVFLNCARGGLVDETAVVEALDSGHFWGAAFDVFENEPPRFPHALMSHPKAVCTAHLGGFTAEAHERAAIASADHILEFFNRSKKNRSRGTETLN